MVRGLSVLKRDTSLLFTNVICTLPNARISEKMPAEMSEYFDVAHVCIGIVYANLYTF